MFTCTTELFKAISFKHAKKNMLFSEKYVIRSKDRKTTVGNLRI